MPRAGEFWIAICKQPRRHQLNGIPLSGRIEGLVRGSIGAPGKQVSKNRNRRWSAVQSVSGSRIVEGRSLLGLRRTVAHISSSNPSENRDMRNSQASGYHMARVLMAFAIVISWAFFLSAQRPGSLCAAEPNAPDAECDEEIYGKSTIGPRTPTALEAAVAASNLKLSEFAELYRRQSEQGDRENPPNFKPLTAEEVVAAINDWDRAKLPVEDATYRLYADIAKTRTLPPHSLLEIDDQWLRRGKHEIRTCRIMLVAMTGKNRGYSFIVRKIEFDQQPCPRPGYRWLHFLTRKDPVRGRIGWKDGSVTISFDEDESQALVVNVNRPYDVAGLQVVAMDEHQVGV